MYRQISISERTATGNSKLPRKLDHWDALVSHFGGHEGAGHEPLHTSSSPALSDGESSGEDSDESVVKRMKFTTPNGNRSETTSRTSKLEASISIGSEIKEGLIKMGRQLSNAAGRQPSGMSEVTELLKRQSKQLAQQAAETHNLLHMLMEAILKKVNSSSIY